MVEIRIAWKVIINRVTLKRWKSTIGIPKKRERERDWGTIATESCDLDRDFVSASIQSLIIFYAYVYSFLAA